MLLYVVTKAVVAVIHIKQAIAPNDAYTLAPLITNDATQLIRKVRRKAEASNTNAALQLKTRSAQG
jgi:hypothetical protein